MSGLLTGIPKTGKHAVRLVWVLTPRGLVMVLINARGIAQSLFEEVPGTGLGSIPQVISEDHTSHQTTQPTTLDFAVPQTSPPLLPDPGPCSRPCPCPRPCPWPRPRSYLVFLTSGASSSVMRLGAVFRWLKALAWALCADVLAGPFCRCPTMVPAPETIFLKQGSQ